MVASSVAEIRALHRSVRDQDVAGAACSFAGTTNGCGCRADRLTFMVSLALIPQFALYLQQRRTSQQSNKAPTFFVC